MSSITGHHLRSRTLAKMERAHVRLHNAKVRAQQAVDILYGTEESIPPLTAAPPHAEHPIPGHLASGHSTLEQKISSPSLVSLPALTHDLTTLPKYEIPPRDHNRPLRILCLDGGGVRGYSALIILEEFMARVQKAYNSTTPILVADFFDFIIGTSTGGIMALMLGRLRMTVEQCLESYRTLAAKVFGAGVITNTVNVCTSILALEGPSIYDELKLEKYVKRAVKLHTPTQDENALIDEPSPDGCRTAVVTARSIDATRPVLMRSYPTPDTPALDHFKIWEAARATSAAPLFFKPVHVGRLQLPYIDGAVSGNCNPTTLAIDEVDKIWPDREVGLLLSLGTGSPSAVSLQGQLHQLAAAFMNLSSNTVHVHESTSRMYDRLYTLSPYIRFSVDHQLEKIRMDDYRFIPEIAAATASYLEMEQTTQLMKRSVALAVNELTPVLKPACLRKLSLMKRTPPTSPTVTIPAPPYEQKPQLTLTVPAQPGA
ncbi:FabD/lysophospholipase-like protein [Ceratobasidium sp. AG-I]|nr:FabD/lysophospholipase-like protein [Ceratobasidium sp. AG-I]